MKKKIGFQLMVACSLLLASCTWVETTEEGALVQLVSTVDANCELVGRVTTSVEDSVGPIDRNENRVRDELIALAKNRAAVLQGNTILMTQPPQEGEAGFEVFTCP